MDKSEQGHASGSRSREQVRRRRHTREEKLAIVRECLQPGASLAGVALAHRANANMVRKWVVKFQHGGFGPVPGGGTALVPVVVGRRSPARVPVKPATSGPTLEIELPRGVIRVYGVLEPGLLESFIAALAGR
ncbi:MAG: transposase [Burkholderiales bacterium]|nr:transposase [Burkholderiales bacterium]